MDKTLYNSLMNAYASYYQKDNLGKAGIKKLINVSEILDTAIAKKIANSSYLQVFKNEERTMTKIANRKKYGRKVKGAFLDIVLEQSYNYSGLGVEVYQHWQSQVKKYVK